MAKSAGSTKASHKLNVNAHWQTKARGSNNSEYQLYLTFAKGSDGNDITTGKPLKTFDEWIAT